MEKAKRPERLPVVLTRDDVRRIIMELRGTAALIAKLLYGSGLRLNEAMMLRVTISTEVSDVDVYRAPTRGESLVGPAGE